MLCLSRFPGERVICGRGETQVVVEVVRVVGGRGVLGFIAEPTVPLHRQEVFEQIDGEQANGDQSQS